MAPGTYDEVPTADVEANIKYQVSCMRRLLLGTWYGLLMSTNTAKNIGYRGGSSTPSDTP